MINITPIVIRQKPHAFASIKGSPDYPNISGNVYFYQTKSGVLVVASVRGLPHGTGACPGAVLGFHIHGGDNCTGDEADYFGGAMTHYNPHNCPHPLHSGDMPPLFVCAGNAFMAFMTDRFTAREITGKTVIIHSSPDDFTTQPSGNSGVKIACGVIRPYR